MSNINIWPLGMLQKDPSLVYQIFRKLVQTCKDLMTIPYYRRNIWILDLRSYSRLPVHVMQGSNIFFNCPTPIVKGQLTAVFRNYTYTTYNIRILLQWYYPISKVHEHLCFYNMTSNRKAASNVSEFMWEFFSSTTPPSTLPFHICSTPSF